MSKHNKTLFIGDLSLFCTERDLFMLFSNYGEIESIKLMRGREEQPLGYAFLTFVDENSCASALSLDGRIYQGRKLKVAKAFRKNPAPIESTGILSFPGFQKPIREFLPSKIPLPPPISFETAQVHVSFICLKANTRTNEAEIASLFHSYGCPIQDVSIKKSVVHKTSKGQSGYGFVHFPFNPEGISAAVRASNDIRQLVVNNVLYDCFLSHDLEAFLKSASSAAHLVRMEAPKFGHDHFTKHF